LDYRQNARQLDDEKAEHTPRSKALGLLREEKWQGEMFLHQLLNPVVEAVRSLAAPNTFAALK
jgi:hypothetical protein